MDGKPLTLSTGLVTGNSLSIGFNSQLFYTNIFYISLSYVEDFIFAKKVYDYRSASILDFSISGLRLK